MHFVGALSPPGGGLDNGDVDWAGGFGNGTMTPFVGDLNADGYGDRIVAMSGGAQWECDLSSPAGFGDAVSDISSTAGFGTTGDILLLSDVLFDCQYPDGDLNEDCIVDFLDFAIMAESYLLGNGPELSGDSLVSHTLSL